MITFEDQQYETDSVINICAYHQDHPEDMNWPRCTCYAQLNLIPKHRYAFKPSDLQAAINFITDTAFGGE